MLSRALALPLALLALLSLYMAWREEDSRGFLSLYSWWPRLLIGAVVLLAVVLVMAPQIDWWWWRRRPPTLDAGQRRLLLRLFPFFQALGPAEKQRFEHRCALFLRSREFIAKGSEAVPDDLQLLIAANAVQLSFGQADYFVERYAHIVVYPHAFPSPSLPFLHSAERQAEDQVLIFDAERLLLAHLRPHEAYNIALHLWAEAFAEASPATLWPKLPEHVAEAWPSIRGFGMGSAAQYLGLPEATVPALLLETFFARPQALRAQWPEGYARLAQWLNLDPLLGAAPVLQASLVEKRPF